MVMHISYVAWQTWMSDSVDTLSPRILAPFMVVWHLLMSNKFPLRRICNPTRNIIRIWNPQISHEHHGKFIFDIEIHEIHKNKLFVWFERLFANFFWLIGALGHTKCSLLFEHESSIFVFFSIFSHSFAIFFDCEKVRTERNMRKLSHRFWIIP